MNRISRSLPLAALPLLLLVGAAGAQEGAMEAPMDAMEAREGMEIRVDPGQEDSPVVKHAIAVLHPTEGNDARGVVRFEATDEGLVAEGTLRGAEPGLHGTHVHLYGDCSAADGTSAGTHFNFVGSSQSPPEDIDRITGDLGNFDVAEDGTGELSEEIPRAFLQGPYAILGRAVVVHEKPNDPSQPPIGGAGGRIACGVIGIAQE